MTILFDCTAGDIELHGIKPSENRFPLTAIPTVTISGGTDEVVDIDDANWSGHNGSNTVTAANMQAATPLAVAYRSLDPAIATVDAAGVVSHESNGIARIVADTFRGSERINVTVQAVQVNPSSPRTWNSWHTGTLAKYLCDYIDGLIAGKNAAAQYRNFFTADASQWLATNLLYADGVQIFPISYKNTMPSSVTDGSWGGATAVHPRFAIMSHHYYPELQVGTQYTWKRPGNTDVTRTVVAYYNPYVNTPQSPDMGILQLDSDLPEDIGFARILPTDWNDYLPSFYTDLLPPFPDPRCGVAGFWKGKHRRIEIQNFVGVYNTYNNAPIPSDNTSNYFIGNFYTPDADSERYRYFQDASSGDSSNGTFLIDPSDKHLILLFPQGSGYQGASVVNYTDEINTWMDSKVSGASLTHADFSSWTNYGA